MRGYSDEGQAIGGGVGFSDNRAVARGHLHWTNTSPSAGDLAYARLSSILAIKHGLGLGTAGKCIGVTASLIRSQR